MDQLCRSRARRRANACLHRRRLVTDQYLDPLQDLGLSLDPMTNHRTMYVAGNPINMVDEDGHYGMHAGCRGRCAEKHYGYSGGPRVTGPSRDTMMGDDEEMGTGDVLRTALSPRQLGGAFFNGATLLTGGGEARLAAAALERTGLGRGSVSAIQRALGGGVSSVSRSKKVAISTELGRRDAQVVWRSLLKGSTYTGTTKRGVRTITIQSGENAGMIVRYRTSTAMSRRSREAGYRRTIDIINPNLGRKKSISLKFK